MMMTAVISNVFWHRDYDAEFGKGARVFWSTESDVLPNLTLCIRVTLTPTHILYTALFSSAELHVI